MLKKMFIAGLLMAALLSVSACGKDAGTAGGNESTELSSEEPPSTEEETDGSTEEDSQSTEESEDSAEEEPEENTASYIFSQMPVAAYEVKGWKIGPDEEDLYRDDTDDGDYMLFMELTSDEENTFILYCLPGGDQSDGRKEYGVSQSAAIQSPAGSSLWEAHTYTTGDYHDMYVPEGCSRFSRMRSSDFSEETYEGRFGSMVDPWTIYIRFSEIFHPDAPEKDTIYAIEIVSINEASYDEAAIVSAMIKSFEWGGATLSEISVEDALAKDNIIVAENGVN